MADEEEVVDPEILEYEKQLQTHYTQHYASHFQSLFKTWSVYPEPDRALYFPSSFPPRPPFSLSPPPRPVSRPSPPPPPPPPSEESKEGEAEPKEEKEKENEEEKKEEEEGNEEAVKERERYNEELKAYLTAYYEDFYYTWCRNKIKSITPSIVEGVDPMAAYASAAAAFVPVHVPAGPQPVQYQDYAFEGKFNKLNQRFTTLDSDEYWEAKGVPKTREERQLSLYFDTSTLNDVSPVTGKKRTPKGWKKIKEAKAEKKRLRRIKDLIED